MINGTQERTTESKTEIIGAHISDLLINRADVTKIVATAARVIETGKPARVDYFAGSLYFVALITPDPVNNNLVTVHEVHITGRMTAKKGIFFLDQF